MDQKQNVLRRASIAAAALMATFCVSAPTSAAANDCPSSGEGAPNVCGFVFNDANGNGIQDVGETGIAGVQVTASDGSLATTDNNGFYALTLPAGGDYVISISTSLPPLGPGTLVSPTDNPMTSDDTDSDGIDSHLGYSYVNVSVPYCCTQLDIDFGFYTSAVAQPGTGTPGYWKNHPEAWPVATITVGGMTYNKAEAIAWLGKVGKDKTTTMFSSLVPAMLNVLIGNDSSCVATTITAANAWMALYPVGSGVPASSSAWAQGEPLHQQMDAYNNGLLCAPHRK